MDTPRTTTDTGTCSLCLKQFGRSDMIDLQGRTICGACKPLFVQMLQEGHTQESITVARHKRALVMGRDARLPDRCVKCNAPAQGRRLKRNLFWHPPLVYLLLLVNLLVFIIVGSITRKKATIEIGLCQKHAARRKADLLIAWLLGLTSVGLLFAGLTAELWVLGACGGVLLLVAMIFGAIRVPLVSARKIDRERIHLNGVCKPFLHTLPVWAAPEK